MWFLKDLKTEEVVHYLLAGEEYTVGRRDANIMITDDPSISRRHAVFVLSHPELNLNNAEKLAILTVKDSGSKYGTYLNKDKQIGPEGVILKMGDRITFGQCDSSYELCHKPILISTSCIEGEEKKLLKQSIWKLGGHIVSEWRTNCTHLVMKEIKVTIKAVCAMVSLTPIVTATYFKDLLQAIREKKNHPNVERYVPKCGELLLTKENVSFGPNLNRKKLFQNKKFICTSQKQYKKLHIGISLASGTVCLLDKDDEVKESILLHPDTIVMKHQSDSAMVSSPGLPSHVQIIEQKLKKNKKRTIPESDIGLAVVYCSTKRYCNPSFDLGSTLFTMPNLQSQTLTQDDIYIAGTQSMQSSTRSKDRFGSFVAESLERSHISPIKNSPKTPSRKRDREEEINPEQSSKHLKLEDTNVPNLQKAMKTKPTVPISLEDELPKRIKVENVENSPVRSSIPNYDENEMTECIQTQVWEDSSSILKPKTEHLESLRTSTLDCKDESTEPVQTQVLEDISNRNVPNGFITKPKKDNSVVNKPRTSDSHDELPSRLVNVEYAALCPPRPARVKIADSTLSNGNVRNFKKFRKVYSALGVLPRIIGGRDLVAYDKSSSKALEEWLSQNPETQPEREEIGLFDWDSNSRARRR